MFGLSFLELAIIAILALLLLGADQLPQAARTVGKGLREFRRATEDLKDQIETEMYADERNRRQPPVAPVPAAPPPEAGPSQSPAGVPEYLPGFEPSTTAAQPDAAATPVESEPASAPPEDPARPPRS